MRSRSRRSSRVRVLGALAVAPVLLFAAPAAAAAPTWTIAPSANPSGAQSSYLESVSCAPKVTTPPLKCYAVGSYTTSTGTVRTLIERWNGSSWSVVTSANRAGALVNTLKSVSCTSATSCFAVGTSRTTATSAALTLIERWDGTSWTKMTSPNVAGATNTYLNSVSCGISTKCYAVGSYTATGAADRPVIERWDGTSWKIVASPGKPGAVTSSLTGVSCTKAIAGVNCFAVGSWSPSAGGLPYYTLTLRWTGTVWKIVASPNAGGNHRSAFNAVSCTSKTFCIAVGIWEHAPGASFIARWNGTIWKATPSQQPLGFTFSDLNGVSCTATNSCDAVGLSSVDGLTYQTFTEHWSGTGWTIRSSANPSQSPGASLASASCITTRCLAVGNYLQKTFANPPGTLALRRG